VCEDVTFLGLSVDSLKLLLLRGTSTDGSLVCLRVGLSGDDLVAALGVVHVGNSDVNSLLEHSAIDLLLDADTYSSLVDVEDDTGAAMVVLEGHALVDGGIHLNIYVVASLEGSQVCGGVGHTLGAEPLLEEGAGLRSVTK